MPVGRRRGRSDGALWPAQFFPGRRSEAQWQKHTYQPLTGLFEHGQGRGEVRTDIPASQLAKLYVGVNPVTISNWLARSPGHDTLDGRLLQPCRVPGRIEQAGEDTATAPVGAGTPNPQHPTIREPPSHV